MFAALPRTSGRGVLQCLECADGGRGTGVCCSMRYLRVLELHGEIDFSRRRSIEITFDTVGRPGSAPFTILDLTRVGYLDTTFLNALLRARDRMAKEQPKSQLCLVAPRSNMIWRLFEIVSLGPTFALFDNLAAARTSAFAALPLTITKSA
jgi:anti-anti-sigma regulatory factor